MENEDNDLRTVVHMQQEALKDMALDIKRIKDSKDRDSSDQWKMISDVCKTVQDTCGVLIKAIEKIDKNNKKIRSQQVPNNYNQFKFK